MADMTNHHMAPVEILQKDKLRYELKHNLNRKDYVKFGRLNIFLINSRFRNKNNCSYKVQTGKSNLVNVYFPLSSLITFWMVFPSLFNFWCTSLDILHFILNLSLFQKGKIYFKPHFIPERIKSIAYYAIFSNALTFANEIGYLINHKGMEFYAKLHD